MKTAHTVDVVRTAEAELMARLPPGTLMQRAAAGLATVCARLLRDGTTLRPDGAARRAYGRTRSGRVYGARVVIVAGSGDNGGDALWAGARLARRGARVDAIVLEPSKVHAEGLEALRSAGGRIVPVDADAGAANVDVSDVISRADLVLDGIVGIGGKPGLRENAVAVVDLIEQYGRPVVAVDVPSGIAVDTGETPKRCVRATTTVTFGTHKIGLLVDPGAAAAGTVEFVDIGLGPYLPAPAVDVLGPSDVAATLPTPDREAHKYSRGVLGVLAGSEQFTGAAALAVGGALRGFVGMVRYVGPPAPTALVREKWPEAVIGKGRVQAWLVGSGLGDDPARAADVRAALADGAPVLVDADGLRHLPGRFDGPALLTPHDGELARMLSVDRTEVSARRLHHAREAATRLNATVLLKGATTVIAAPDGRARVCDAGTPWLATAGSGDVLSGVCGSLLASGLDPFDAGSVGTFLHQTAGVRASGGAPITPEDIIAALPATIRDLLRLQHLPGLD